MHAKRDKDNQPYNPMPYVLFLFQFVTMNFSRTEIQS